MMLFGRDVQSSTDAGRVGSVAGGGFPQWNCSDDASPARPPAAVVPTNADHVAVGAVFTQPGAFVPEDRR